MSIFKLPDLGEGLPDAEIREWHVKVGDKVEVDQPLVSMETAKAVVEVPSPQKGVIKKLYGEDGDVIDTGAALVEFESDAPAQTTEQAPANKSNTVAGNIEEGNETVAETAVVRTAGTTSTSRVKATPAVRALAQRLDVDLSTLTGTGPNGSISINDVKQAGGASSSVNAAPAFEGGEPLKGTRRIMAQTMSESHKQVVPVSIFDSVAIGHWADKDYTYRLIRAICSAVEKEPALNAWYDGKNNARKTFTEVNLGMATDSDEGLIVPVLHNIDKLVKDTNALRAKINETKEKVKARAVPQDELKGASITLSNFGMYAGQFATPIIVPPQVAILGAGRIHDAVVAEDGNAVVQKVMPLSLTFDHRAITGGEATRFLGLVMADLKQVD